MSDAYVDELLINTARRIPVCFVVDTSKSMQTLTHYDPKKHKIIESDELVDGKRRKKVVNLDGSEPTETRLNAAVTGVNRFLETIRNSDEATDACDIAIITYDKIVNVVNDFTGVSNIDEFKFNPDDCQDATVTGEAVTTALQILKERKEKYQKMKIDYCQPWIVIFTDGEPQDDVKEAQAECTKLQNDDKLVVFPFVLLNRPDERSGDRAKAEFKATLEKLAGFTKKGVSGVLTLADDIEKFFEFLGKSISAAAEDESDPDEDYYNSYDVSDLE